MSENIIQIFYYKKYIKTYNCMKEKEHAQVEEVNRYRAEVIRGEL